jgi:hypothetical protein
VLGRVGTSSGEQDRVGTSSGEQGQVETSSGDGGEGSGAKTTVGDCVVSLVEEVRLLSLSGDGLASSVMSPEVCKGRLSSSHFP